MNVTIPRRVGKSKLEVTPLGFGAAPIGRPGVTNEESLAIVAGAWGSGVRFFDTAPWYGIGRSERRLGLGLAGVAGRDAAPSRAEYRINTKVGRTLVPEAVRDDSKRTSSPGGEVRTARDPLTGFRVDFNYTYDRILRQYEDSLQRLGLSSVDSLTIHDIDYGHHSPEQIELHLAELAEGAAALMELRESGAISAVGCGCNLGARNRNSWPGGEHEDLCERIVDLVDLDFFLIAGAYTLLETRALRRILPLCLERGIGVVIGAPYATGLLAAPDRPDVTYGYAAPPDEVSAKVAGMQSICRGYNVPLAAVAIQFPLAHPAVAAVIPGAESPEEVQQTCEYLHTPVPAALWQKLKDEGLLDRDAPIPRDSD